MVDLRNIAQRNLSHSCIRWTTGHWQVVPGNSQLQLSIIGSDMPSALGLVLYAIRSCRLTHCVCYISEKTTAGRQAVQIHPIQSYSGTDGGCLTHKTVQLCILSLVSSLSLVRPWFLSWTAVKVIWHCLVSGDGSHKLLEIASLQLSAVCGLGQSLGCPTEIQQVQQAQTFMGMGYAVGTSVATALKVVQRHRPFLAKPERKASRIVFSNEKPPPQWQKCNAHCTGAPLL